MLVRLLTTVCWETPRFVMDNSLIGAGTVIAAGTLVPPGKTLEGGWLYSGNPARPVREIFKNERETLRAALLSGEANKVVCEPDLPPLDMALICTDGWWFGTTLYSQRS